jgi:hypothetical protein
MLVALMSIGATPRSARGEIVTFEFSAAVVDISGNLGVFGPFGMVQLNDLVTGRFSYETGVGNPDQMPGDPEIGVYSLVGFEIDQAVVDIAPLAVVIFHQEPLPVVDPMAPPSPGTDAFTAAGQYEIGDTLFIVSVRLEGPYESVFSDDSLPSSLIPGDFQERVVRSIRVIGLDPGGSQIDQARLLTLAQVPEPASLALVILGAIGLAIFARRRQS